MKIITGMHRSGTSLIARLFHAGGADMGDERTFYRPDQWNPDGYFEQPDIHSVNFPLINGPFWKFSYFWLPSAPVVMKRAEKMSTRIAHMAKKYDGKVIKETRFCLTMPAWQKYDAKIEKVLICLRDPIQVAQSLRKRNWITLNHAFYLWKEHNLRLLSAIKGVPSRFIYYGDLLKENAALPEIREAFNFFGISLSDEKLTELGRRHIKPDMNNNPAVDFAYPADIQALWNELFEKYKRQNSLYPVHAN